jgi:glycerophosphoryl diester phosphodiesterase
MIIEMKPAVYSPAAQLWSLLCEYPQIIPNVLVASFCDRYMDEFRKLSRGIVATSVSVIELIELLLGFRGFEEPVRPCLVDAPHRLLRHFLMKKFRRRSYAVHAWTVNKRPDMERMQDLGVDGIITDYPTLLRDVLGRSG